jgi:MFS family permease
MALDEERGHVRLESEAGDGFGDVATEYSPLLNTDIPPDVVPDQSFQRLVVGMCVLFLFIVEVSTFIMQPALQQLLETRICAEIFPDLGLETMSDTDDRCKGNRVQKELAMLRSWAVAAAMFVRKSLSHATYKPRVFDQDQHIELRNLAFFVQIPYGIIADKYGRRPVLFLALFGTVLQAAWVLLVRKYSRIQMVNLQIWWWLTIHSPSWKADNIFRVVHVVR